MGFQSLVDMLEENIGSRWVDVYECLEDLREENEAYRDMYYFIFGGGAPPGYDLIEKETHKCYNKVVEDMRSDEESGEESGEEPSEEYKA